LTLTVSSAGAATWILRYRLEGKQREVTLGRYPEYSIKDAKDLAIAARRKVMDGIDPAREKRQARVTKAADQSFKALALDYQAKALPSLAASTIAAKEYHIREWLIPHLGSIATRDITPADIVQLVEAAGQRSRTATPLIFETLAAIFDHGIARSVINANPCAGIKVTAVLGKAPETKPRVKLSEEELRLILPALPNARSGIAIRLLLITAVRVSELLQAEWRHIDLDRAEWTIPDEHAKTMQGFVIPLPLVAVDLFSCLQTLSCGSDYVLPGQGKEPIMTRGGIRAFIDRLLKNPSDVRHFSAHDLRSTCRSHLSSLGISVVVAERCLNHSLGGVVAVYDQHDYRDERRRALTLWCDYLTTIEQGREWTPEADNVVPIRLNPSR